MPYFCITSVDGLCIMAILIELEQTGSESILSGLEKICACSLDKFMQKENYT